MPKLYTHKDKFVELEFRNLYDLIGKGPQGVIGATGPIGPQGDVGNTGAQGPQGESYIGAILSLKKYVYESELAGPTEVTIGTLPAHHIVVDIIGLMIVEFDSQTLDHIFSIGNSTDIGYFYLYTTVSNPSGNNITVWPDDTTYGDAVPTPPVSWMGLYDSSSRIVKLKETNADINGPGRFAVMVNYIDVSDLFS